MRGTVAAAVLGALAGGLGVWLVTPGGRPVNATSRSGEETMKRLARIESRLDALATSVDRLSTRLAADARAAREPGTVPASADFHGAVAGEFAPASEPPAADFSRATSADLELQADERHARDQDIAGAVQRYRVLLGRGGTPAQIQHWSLRLGDCWWRLSRMAAARDAYQAAFDASPDGEESLVALCGIVYATHDADPVRALDWVDVGLRKQDWAERYELHCLGADNARSAGRVDRERQELTWLVEHFPTHRGLATWKERLAELESR